MANDNAVNAMAEPCTERTKTGQARHLGEAKNVVNKHPGGLCLACAALTAHDHTLLSALRAGEAGDGMGQGGPGGMG